MKLKNIAMVSFAATFTAPLMADDWFIGGSIGAQKNRFNQSYQHQADTEVGAENLDISAKETDVLYDVKLGRYFGEQDQNRIYTSYSYNSGSSDDLGDAKFRQQNVLLSYDYMVPLAESKVNWFIGASAGYSYTQVYGPDLGSQNNFVYGGQTGFEYQVNPVASVELGYKYLKQDYSKGASYEDGTSFNFDMDKSEQLYLGVNYRF